MAPILAVLGLLIINKTSISINGLAFLRKHPAVLHTAMEMMDFKMYKALWNSQMRCKDVTQTNRRQNREQAHNTSACHPHDQ